MLLRIVSGVLGVAGLCWLALLFSSRAILVGEEMRALGPATFPTRRLQSYYLDWVLRHVEATLPPGEAADAAEPAPGAVGIEVGDVDGPQDPERDRPGGLAPRALGVRGGDAEHAVRDPGRAVEDREVVGLEIAVDDVMRVRDGERAHHGHHDLECLRRREPPGPIPARAQPRPVQDVQTSRCT